MKEIEDLHTYRNKLWVIQGAISDILSGKSITDEELRDALAATELLLRKLDEQEQAEK